MDKLVPIQVKTILAGKDCLFFGSQKFKLCVYHFTASPITRNAHSQALQVFSRCSLLLSCAVEMEEPIFTDCRKIQHIIS